MATSPTQRTLAYCKKLGRTSGIVEKWNSFIKIRQDLFGFIDIICIDKDKGIVAVQSTGSAHSEHIKKLTVDRKEIVTEWLKSGAPLELISWRKVKKVRGGKAMVWKPRICDFTLDEDSNIIVIERD